MKALLTLSLLALFVAGGVVLAAAGGYNFKSLTFVGTGMQWCQQRIDANISQADCETALGGPYTNDKLVMKWSNAWQMAVFGPDGVRNNGDEAPWTTDAWENNYWNGMVPNGSGEIYSTKIVWVGTPCDSSNPNWRPGGECIWGQFETILEQGVDSSGHWWGVHATPSGYGGF